MSRLDLPRAPRARTYSRRLPSVLAAGLLAMGACGDETVQLEGRAFTDASGSGSGEALVGARVEVSGDARFAGATDAAGAFAVAVPPRSELLVRLEAEGHMGLLEAEALEGVDRSRDYGLTPEPLVDALLASVDLVRDRSRGIVVVDFETTSVAGGETATLVGDFEAVLTRTERGAFVRGDLVAPGGEDTFLSFINVAPGEIEVRASSPTERCEVERGGEAWPVRPNVVTTVRVTCGPR